jgi:pimeloyl-ACP methyl ester carboxylesterase
MIRKRYVDGPFGQIHLRESAEATGTVPLICLHATAYSSRSFETLMRAFGASRHLIALDLPGYGDSEAPTTKADMAGYADAVAAAIGAGPVDLFGYHTGVYVAAELALRHPAKIRRMTFMGIPYFQALDFEQWRARLATPHRLGAALEQFTERWAYLVNDRPTGVSLERGFANFVDELKAWPNGSWAHEAMFAWDADTRLPLIDCPVTVLNPEGHLAGASRAAAALIANAIVIELPELNGAVLELHGDRIAALIPSEE